MKKQFLLKLDEKTKKELRIAAAIEELSMTAFITKLIEEHIQRKKED